MFRTFAVLLLLLGLATATPVVCLCVPSQAAGTMAGLLPRADDAATRDSARSEAPAGSSAADAPSLVATSAAAVVASLVATAGGLPSTMPWQPSPAVIARWLPPDVAIAAGPASSPLLPPPR